jgi:uncharacterized protein (TIGR02186 family)
MVTMRRAGMMAAMLAALAGPARAQAVGNPLVVDLARDHVDITLGFNGTQLAVFGTKAQDGDVAVVIRGPEVPAVVRRKAQVMGIWMNTQSVTFRNVPVYYDLALSRSEADINAAAALKDHKIGMNTLDFRPDRSGNTELVGAFQEALIRNRQVQGYFPLEPRRINFLSGQFFRADFQVPPSVPAGDYVVQTYLIRNGVVDAVDETKLRIAQVGFNARLFAFSRKHAFIYGLAAIFVAVTAGWASYAFMRRD